MDMRAGTRPHLLDTRDHALHKTFPQFAAATPKALPLLEYNYDAGLTMPSQNEPNALFSPPLPPLFFGCTGYTQTDICGDEDETVYDPQYTYERSCDMEGHGYAQGCDIRTSMKALTVYGLRKQDETQNDAQMRKRGKYFIIDKLRDRDWFDSFRIALRSNRRSISVGVPWFPEWWSVGPDGVLTSLFIYDGDPSHYLWHNAKVSGETTLDNGEPALLVKSWQGRSVGDGGWLKWDRATFNKAYDIYGTFSATPGLPVSKEDIRYVEITLYQQVLLYLNYMLRAMRLPRVSIYA